MIAPVAKLRKDKIIWLTNHKCEAHGRTYLNHYHCYLEEVDGAKERLAFYDIEASNLDADYGIMLSWAIKPSDGKEIISDVLTPKDVRSGYEDKRIVQSSIDALLKFDTV